jgi:hypothetical protein
MSGAEFVELEEVDAVRMVWNVWPHSRLEAAKCVIPFGVIYTPAKQTSQLQVRRTLGSSRAGTHTHLPPSPALTPRLLQHGPLPANIPSNYPIAT